MDSSNSAVKEEYSFPKSLLGRFSGHPFEYEIKTYEDMKKVIQRKSVRASLLFIAGASLPFSGTSTLIQGILNSYDIPLPNSRELRVYPSAVFIDSVKKEGLFLAFEEDQRDDGVLLIALTKKVLAKKYTIDSSLQYSGQLFKNSDVDQYFKQFCDKLLQFKEHLEKDPRNLAVALMKSHSFINFLDITVNKAIYECLFIVGSWCKKGFLLSVLNLYYYSCEVLKKPLDLSEAHFQERGYHQVDVNLLKVHSACYFFISIFEGTFAKQENKENRALLVCTHTDELSTEEALTRRKKIEEIICECGQSRKVSIPLVSDILAIDNTKGSPDYKAIQQKLITLIEDCKYSDNIELKHLFFYSYLKKIGRKFLTYKEVVDLGSECEIEEKEVKKCLELFHDSCFLFHIYDFVILDLPCFIDDIDKLYCVESGEMIKHGFFSKGLCHEVWGKNSPKSDIYISVLTKVGLITELKGHSYDYFMPSLRAEYEYRSVDSSVTSLLVLTGTSIIPCHKQCMFVENFQRSGAKVLGSSSYNVLELQLQNNVIVKILFCDEFLEVSLTIPSKLHQSAIDSTTYSSVKSSCAEVLNQIRGKSTQKSHECFDFRYTFAVCCPKSNPQASHYILIEESCQSDTYFCSTCKRHFNKEEMDERVNWIISACTVNTVHDDDKLNAKNLMDIAKKLTSSSHNSYSGDLCTFFEEHNKKMKPDTGSCATCLEFKSFISAEDRLFHDLYTWYSYNTSASRIKLAKVMYDNGFDEPAFAILSQFQNLLGTKKANFKLHPVVIKQIAELGYPDPHELATILKVELQTNLDATETNYSWHLKLLQEWSERNVELNQEKELKDLYQNHGYYIPKECFQRH